MAQRNEDSRSIFAAISRWLLGSGSKDLDNLNAAETNAELDSNELSMDEKNTDSEQNNASDDNQEFIEEQNLEASPDSSSLEEHENETDEENFVSGYVRRIDGFYEFIPDDEEKIEFSVPLNKGGDIVEEYAHAYRDFLDNEIFLDLAEDADFGFDLGGFKDDLYENVEEHIVRKQFPESEYFYNICDGYRRIPNMNARIWLIWRQLRSEIWRLSLNVTAILLAFFFPNMFLTSLLSGFDGIGIISLWLLPFIWALVYLFSALVWDRLRQNLTISNPIWPTNGTIWCQINSELSMAACKLRKLNHSAPEMIEMRKGRYKKKPIGHWPITYFTGAPFSRKDICATYCSKFGVILPGQKLVVT